MYRDAKLHAVEREPVFSIRGLLNVEGMLLQGTEQKKVQISTMLRVGGRYRYIDLDGILSHRNMRALHPFSSVLLV